MFYLTAFFVFSLTAFGADPVPTQYQALYDYLQTQISGFHGTVPQNTPAPVTLFGAELHGANANRGADLVAPGNYENVLKELDYLKALGSKIVHVSVGFPALSTNYYSNPTTAQQIQNFYAQLAVDIRARGIDGSLQSSSYLGSLSLADYISGRAQTAVKIAQLMTPEYMTVLNEPDTEAFIAQKPSLAGLNDSLALLRGILYALSTSGVSGMKVGAGVGSWTPYAREWVTVLSMAPIQYIDVHIFPVANDWLTRLVELTNIAQGAGKKIASSQLWLHKATLQEMSSLSWGQIHARDPWSFWEPLDNAFLHAVNDWARASNAEFATPYWARHFRSYLDFSQYGGLTGSALESTVALETARAGGRGEITDVGVFFATDIIAPQDTTAPSVPTNLTGFGANSNTVSLNWSGSTDNVGVLGYRIYRDGVPVATTQATTYLDPDLGWKTHIYAVTAYDATGNESARSNELPQTPLDTVPPATPSNLVITTPDASIAQLNWDVSADNAGVNLYQIYRGTTPTQLAAIGTSPVNSFTDVNVIPATTFYYALSATDAAGNLSGTSAPVPVTLPADTTAPSVPAGLAGQATGQSSVSLTWQASTDNWHMGGYRVYRGTSPTSLNLLAGATTTSYVDTQATQGVTYYYAVAAFDAYGNTSAQSAPIQVSMGSDAQPPSTPTSLSGVAATNRRINLSWNASTDNVGVYYYVVLRGTTASNISMIGYTAGTTYADTTVNPRTTYLYLVVAVDAAGNKSGTSNAITVTTPR